MIPTSPDVPSPDSVSSDVVYIKPSRGIGHKVMPPHLTGVHTALSNGELVNDLGQSATLASTTRVDIGSVDVRSNESASVVEHDTFN